MSVTHCGNYLQATFSKQECCQQKPIFQGYQKSAFHPSSTTEVAKAMQSFHHRSVFFILAGLPPTIAYGSTFFTTVALAAIIAPSPTLTPGIIVTF